MATQNYGEQKIDIEDIPPIPTNQTSSSSSNEDPSDPVLTYITFLSVLNVIQIVASILGLWVSIVHEHPDNKLITWVVGYASGCAVMFPLLYFQCRIVSTLDLRQQEVIIGFWITMGLFFLVWFALGLPLYGGGSSSTHGAPTLETLIVALFLAGCGMNALLTMVLTVAILCLFLPSIWATLDCAKEKSRGASTPDSPNALLTYKFKSKENGGRSGDEGGVILTAGTKKERTLSGEDVVCCICLGEYADNDELRELTCCSHFFHVECVDKWLKSKARCPLCQYEFGGAGGAGGAATC